MAKCRVCHEKAVVKLDYARLWLCEKHFVEFFEKRVAGTIERYDLLKEDEQVLVGVSGGKDSLSLFHVLRRLGYDVVAVHLDLGFSEFSRQSLDAVNQVARNPIVVSVHDVLGCSVAELAWKTHRKVCSVCGTVKRFFLNAAAVELGVRKVALGHNLDDLCAYAIKSFLTQDLTYISKLGPSTEPIDGLAAGRIRPLCEVSEKECFLYAFFTGLPFIKEECPYRPRKSLELELKKHLAFLEDSHPGLKLALFRKLVKNLHAYPRGEEPLTKCAYCGLISSRNICSFCSLTKKALGKPMGAEVRRLFRKA